MGTLALPAPIVNALHDDGSLDPSERLHFSDELAVALHDHMVLSRLVRAEVAPRERAGAEALQAVAALAAPSARKDGATLGSVSAMCDEDWVFLGRSEFAAALWRGVPLEACVRHALGSRRALRPATVERDGAVSAPWKSARVMTASRLGGAHVPHAVGVAWAARLRQSGSAVLVLFDDSATSSADFHSGLNFAGVSRAPLIACCCSGEPEGTSTADGVTPRSKARSGFAAKAIAYGLRGVRVNGTDIVAVRKVLREAREHAASGLGGTLVEAVIAPDEEADPVARLTQHLQVRGLWDDKRQENASSEMRADVERAMSAALADEPERGTLFDGVYAELPWHLREQRGELGASR